jgi:hypothetical protein
MGNRRKYATEEPPFLEPPFLLKTRQSYTTPYVIVLFMLSINSVYYGLQFETEEVVEMLTRYTWRYI